MGRPFRGVGGAGGPSAPRLPRLDADSLRYVKPEEFTPMGEKFLGHAPIGQVYGRVTTPEDFFRDRVVGEKLWGDIKSALLDRNKPGQGALLLPVKPEGMKAQIEREVGHFVGPDIKQPLAGGTSYAWYAPSANGSIFVNSSRGRATPHEFFHALLEGAPRKPGAEFSWSPREQFDGSAVDDPDMPPEVYGKIETPEQHIMRLNEIEPQDADDPDIAEAISNAAYNQHPAEMAARLAESKWIQGLREGGLPDTRAGSDSLLQRLLDEPAWGKDPVIRSGPLKGQAYPGFRDHQRALQFNWEALTPEGRRQVQDLFWHVGSNDKPEPGNA